MSRVANEETGEESDEEIVERTKGRLCVICSGKRDAISVGYIKGENVRA